MMLLRVSFRPEFDLLGRRTDLTTFCLSYLLNILLRQASFFHRSENFLPVLFSSMDHIRILSIGGKRNEILEIVGRESILQP